MFQSNIRYSPAGEKDCLACGGNGHNEGVPSRYYDDDLRAWLPDYCEQCSGTGVVAIICDYCDGPVNEHGYCRSCDDTTPVQPINAVRAVELMMGAGLSDDEIAAVMADDLPESGLAA